MFVTKANMFLQPVLMIKANLVTINDAGADTDTQT